MFLCLSLLIFFGKSCKYLFYSEQRLQKEHDFKVLKLKTWQKELEANLGQVLNEVKEFQKKERMSEAQKYVDILDEIQSKIHGFMEEVLCDIGTSTVLLNIRYSWIVRSTFI